MRDRTDAMLERLKPSVLPDSISQRSFAFQERLAASQWLSRDVLERRQLDQLKKLVRFASREVPFWRDRLPAQKVEDASELGEALAALPILSRSALRDNRNALRAASLPAGHHAAGERSSSGSTGMMVSVGITDVVLAVQHGLTLRTHLWAGRDFARSLAVIRRLKSGEARAPSGHKAPHWGPRAVFPFPTGPSLYLNSHNTSVDEYWDWLAREQPAYLLTYPSIVRALAERAAKEKRKPAPLENITTIGELVDEELRALAANHLAPIHDLYSSEEAGLMALQCPISAFYHVPCESLIVEVTDGEGRACPAGQTGRVLVTTLMNYATPLLRYDIGDFAQMGEACACGRGLPTLSRILGRRRNMLTLSDGRTFWPSFGARFMQKIVPVIEHQFRQTEPDVIETWLVTEGEISRAQEQELRAIVAASLPAPLEVRIRRVSAIPRPASGKHEEFVSVIGEPAPREP